MNAKIGTNNILILHDVDQYLCWVQVDITTVTEAKNSLQDK